MTTNPETAGVEPVAWMYENTAHDLRFVDHDHNDVRAVWARSMADGGWTETPLYAHPAPASNTTSVGEVELMARAICAADPDIRMGDAEGVVQQRVEKAWRDYVGHARAALSAMPTADAIRAETTAQVVERCAVIAEGFADMCAGSDDPCTVSAHNTGIAIADTIRDHLTGGGE